MKNQKQQNHEHCLDSNSKQYYFQVFQVNYFYFSKTKRKTILNFQNLKDFKSYVGPFSKQIIAFDKSIDLENNLIEAI